MFKETLDEDSIIILENISENDEAFPTQSVIELLTSGAEELVFLFWFRDSFGWIEKKHKCPGLEIGGTSHAKFFNDEVTGNFE